jgi:hypothetical protein
MDPDHLEEALARQQVLVERRAGPTAVDEQVRCAARAGGVTDVVVGVLGSHR